LRLDASVTDSYNSPAYWDMLSVRGFTLDNRYNYRREGLPISAETMIPMDNKERIELLKGTSGIQAGTSAPGGLVNYVVKRAPANAEQQIRNVTLSYGEGNNRLTAADLGGRFGNSGEFGYRFNVAYEDLNPYIGNTKGHRNLVALAMDWRISADKKLEWEFEQSHREQIGVNAYSLLGNALPPTVNGKRNITRQPWLQPGVFDGITGSVRFKQNLDNGWLWTTQYGLQQLRTDDRLAFAFGNDCYYNSGYTGCKNYSSSGTFDLYDWRSENEKRTTEAIQTEISGSSMLAGLKHDVSWAVTRQRQFDRMSNQQTNNYVGTSSIESYEIGNTNAAYTDSPLSSNRTEYSTELAFKDRIHLSAASSVWTGLKHTMFNRSSSRTDSTHVTSDKRSIDTPWIALTHQLNPAHMIYASYSEGIELNVTPNKSSYTNAGAVLPVLKSQQREVGMKGTQFQSTWQVTWFDITRPAVSDAPDICDPSSQTPSCTRQIDGRAHHKGLDVSGSTKTISQWTLGAGYTWIDAKREASTVTPLVNGQSPINVPGYVFKGMAEYRFSNLPGLRTGLRVTREGERNVTEMSDVKLPAWTTWGASAHYDTKVNKVASTWSLAIDNLTNKEYWRESPKQFGHYYLYPGAPRTIRATVQFRI
jgi:iron complex outermembrane receptor protein